MQCWLPLSLHLSLLQVSRSKGGLLIEQWADNSSLKQSRRKSSSKIVVALKQLEQGCGIELSHAIKSSWLCMCLMAIERVQRCAGVWK